MRRTRFEARIDKIRAMESADAAGQIADSMDYRMALMGRVERGDLSLVEAQAELAKVKRNAKRNGMKTRSQAYREG
jgi:hypothetical protein